MSGTNEIVTFQVGHYANFVGAHFWNLQESSFVYDGSREVEVNHDILFREGCTPRSEATYLPRLIAVDLKGSLKTLREDSVLYSNTENATNLAQVKWPAGINSFTSPSVEKNEFLEDCQKEDAKFYSTVADDDSASRTPSASKTTIKSYNLDNEVEVWSDFLRVHYHPKTIYTVPNFHHANSVQPFDSFCVGQKEFLNDQNNEAMLNKLHFFTEECDQLQGFHILFDALNGFGGYSSELVSLLADEFPNKGIVTLPLYEKQPTDNTSTYKMRLLNSLMMLTRFHESSSLNLPMSLVVDCWDPLSSYRSFPQLKYNSSLPYHTSAPLAVCFDTATLPYRLKQKQASMRDLTDGLTHSNRKFLASSISFPITMEAIYQNTKTGKRNVLLHSVTPQCQIQESDITLQSIVLRGILTRGERTDPRNAQLSLKDSLTNCISEATPSAISSVTVVSDPCDIRAPFPDIFEANAVPQDLGSSKSYGAGVMTGLHNTAAVGSFLGSLSTSLSRRSINHQMAGLDIDDFSEAREQLKNITEFYINT